MPGPEVFPQSKVEDDPRGQWCTVTLVVPGGVVVVYPQRKVASVAELYHWAEVGQRFRLHSPGADEQRGRNCRTDFAPPGAEGGQSLPLVLKRSEEGRSSRWVP